MEEVIQTEKEGKMPTKIEWTDETVNPLGWWCFGTGTKDNPKHCEYCYAKKIALRGINKCELCNTFITLHTHFEQLEKLSKWKKPKNIFIQSMGDLFHGDVPDEWIQEVFNACEQAPQHRYLFLTKNPERYKQYNKYMPNNMWFGATATKPGRLGFDTHHSWNTFISIEPIQAEFPNCYPKNISWLIVGAETGNRKGKVIPKREWIENIVNACRDANVPVFLKNNLAKIWGEPLIQEYPWRAE